MRDFRYQTQAQSIAFEPAKSPDKTGSILNEMDRQVRFRRRNAEFQEKYTNKYINALQQKLDTELEQKKKNFKWKQDLEDAYFKQDLANDKQRFENEYGEKLQDSKQTQQLLDFVKAGTKAAVAIDSVRRDQAERYAKEKLFEYVTPDTVSEAEKIMKEESISYEAAFQKAVFNEAIRSGMSEEDAKRQIDISGYRLKETHNYALQRWGKAWNETFNSPVEDERVFVIGAKSNPLLLRYTKIKGENFGEGDKTVDDILKTGTKEQLAELKSLIKKSHIGVLVDSKVNMNNAGLQGKEYFDNNVNTIFANAEENRRNNWEIKQREEDEITFMSLVQGEDVSTRGGRLSVLISRLGFGNNSHGWQELENVGVRAAQNGQFRQPELEQFKRINIINADGVKISIADRKALISRLQSAVNGYEVAKGNAQEAKEKGTLDSLKRTWANSNLVHGSNLGYADWEQMMKKAEDLGVEPWDELKTWRQGGDKDISSTNKHLKKHSDQGTLTLEMLYTSQASPNLIKELRATAVDNDPIFGKQLKETERNLQQRVSEVVKQQALDVGEAGSAAGILTKWLKQEVKTEANRLWATKAFKTYGEAYEAAATKTLILDDVAFKKKLGWSEQPATTGEGTVPSVTGAAAAVLATLGKSQTTKIQNLVTGTGSVGFVDGNTITEGIAEFISKDQLEKIGVNPNKDLTMLAYVARTRTNWKGSDLDFLNEVRQSYGLDTITPVGATLSSLGLHKGNQPATLSDERNARETDDLKLRAELAVTNVIKNEVMEHSDLTEDEFYNIGSGVANAKQGVNSQFNLLDGTNLSDTSLTKVMDYMQRGDIRSVTGYNIRKEHINKYIKDNNIDPNTKLTPELADAIIDHELYESTETLARTGDPDELTAKLSKLPRVSEAIFNDPTDPENRVVSSVEQYDLVKSMLGEKGKVFNVDRLSMPVVETLLGSLIRESGGRIKRDHITGKLVVNRGY